ncbi:hypothetical protein ScPMuIL_014033 [Solemya velum]
MSTVFVQIGQCGNQMGQAFLSTTIKNEKVQSSHSFLSAEGIPRAIAVDSEQKCVRKTATPLRIRDENIIVGKRGRGTNWAMGYNGPGPHIDDKLGDRTMEALRREIERCDRFCGVILMHSLSGGTGSGLGSRICEDVRDSYPLSHLMSCAVAPCASGESPLQHYNSLLTLSCLQRNTDGIVLIHNDDVISRLQKSASASRSVSLQLVNSAISAELNGIFLPTDTLTPSSGSSLGMEPWELVRSVCPMPSLKFVQFLHQASSEKSLDDVLAQATRRVAKYSSEGRPYGCLASLVVIRGNTRETVSVPRVEGRIKKSYACVSWNPYPVDIWIAKNCQTGFKDKKTVTIAANRTSVLDFLDVVYTKSKTMFNAGAYLHWYERYGVSRDEFNESFEEMKSIAENYSEAMRQS